MHIVDGLEKSGIFGFGSDLKMLCQSQGRGHPLAINDNVKLTSLGKPSCQKMCCFS